MTNSESHKRLSLKEFVWLGFNYAVGIGFIGNFAILSNIGMPNSIGINAIWVYLLIGFVAGNCAWAFAKLSRIHNSDNNGGAYIYIRTTFGRFWGWLVGFMQYVCLPFIVTIQVMMLIRGTFSPEFISNGQPQWYSANWGPFSDLFLDLIGILIYMISASAVFAGIKIYKKMAHTTSIIKWLTAAFLIIAGISLAVTNSSSNWSYWTTNSSLSFAGFMNTFTSCFFFFAGFEIFSTAGKNVNNPEKNIGKGITLIMIIMTVFYIIISLVFFLGYQVFVQNMNMGAWSAFNSKVILYGGPILMIISGLALKINIAMQNALYGGTTLQPLSKEGYISNKLFNLNKDGIPVKAAIVNLMVTAIMLILWLVIPDLIKGIWLVSHPGQKYSSAFNVANLSSSFSVITMFVYIMVLITVLKLALDKKLKLNWYEKIVFPFSLLTLGLMFVWHYYSIIHDAVVATDSSAIVAMVIELIFILSNVIFAITWYFTYYSKKYQLRLKTNPSLQTELNSEFAFNLEHQATLEKINTNN
ncbi:APC family permease [Spiroplasma endosymbiont of Polydrusus pterygomalis]|uniref:APC family permease n=1 Tax=Spiroplasma endosymbiont of Polydrusus pterygomalis TaxID=3139327 RepID=UPI003CCA9A2C